MRSFSHKGSLFYAAIKGLVIFLARGVSVSYCTSQKFNKVSSSSLVDVHKICLIMKSCYVVCFLSIFQNISSLFLIAPMIMSLSLCRPNNYCRIISIVEAIITTKSPPNSHGPLHSSQASQVSLIIEIYTINDIN